MTETHTEYTCAYAHIKALYRDTHRHLHISYLHGYILSHAYARTLYKNTHEHVSHTYAHTREHSTKTYSGTYTHIHTYRDTHANMGMYSIHTYTRTPYKDIGQEKQGRGRMMSQTKEFLRPADMGRSKESTSRACEGSTVS